MKRSYCLHKSHIASLILFMMLMRSAETDTNHAGGAHKGVHVGDGGMVASHKNDNQNIQINSNINNKNNHPSYHNNGGLLYDDDDEEEEDYEDSSDELDLPGTEHNQLLGGPPIRSADKRYQSVLCMYIIH
jgi:hypothetical protein